MLDAQRGPGSLAFLVCYAVLGACSSSPMPGEALDAGVFGGTTGGSGGSVPPAGGAGGAGNGGSAGQDDGSDSGTSPELDGGGAGGSGGSAADAGPPRRGFPPVTSLETIGPFATTGAGGSPEGPACIVHRPATLGEGGLKHPVIIWGMGTGGFNTYGPSFELWASHGFIVAAATLGNGQGDGAEMLACLDHVCETYKDDVDCRAGASGHSQGGGGAIMAAQDPRVITTAPVQPYIAEGFGGFLGSSIAKQTGPMLLLSGTLDTVATPDLNQKPVYETTNVPVLWANRVGGDHVATGIDGAALYKGVILAWFRLQLLGDEDFRAMFHAPDCSLCDDADWLVMPAKGL